MRTPHLVVHSARRAEDGVGRYGLVVSRKFGGAVERNRARRQVRAAIGMAGGIAPGTDSVLIVKPGASLAVPELSKEICQIMDGFRASQGSRGSSNVG